jgi:hypothetical protein
MKRALAVFFLLLTTAAFAQKAVVVGICPFSDDTGTPAGERIATMLPVMFLEKAKSAGFLPVIVNIGPEWIFGENDWPAEVARMGGADVVLVGRVRALAVSNVKKTTDQILNATDPVVRGRVLLTMHTADIVLEATLVDVATGRELATLRAIAEVKGSWLSEATSHVAGGIFHHDTFWFADTPLGQAIGRGAEKLTSDVGQRVSQLATKGIYVAVPTGRSCRIKVRVVYQAKKRASKMFLLAINGKEESLGIADGVVEQDEPSGPIRLHISVKDPPYRQFVQEDYYANSMLDCSRAENVLFFEIGASGEGVIRWGRD